MRDTSTETSTDREEVRGGYRDGVTGQPSYWREAQREELAVWQRTASSSHAALKELAEVAELMEYAFSGGVGRGLDSIVDVGVGPLGVGLGALFGAQQAVAVDPLPRLAPDTGVPALDGMVATLQAAANYLEADATVVLPLDGASFRLVVCDNVIDHTQDPVAVLKECRRLARDDGHLVFGVNVFSRLGLLKWRQLTRRRHRDSPLVLCHPHSFLEKDVAELLGEAGWRLVHWQRSRLAQRWVGHQYRVRVIAEAGPRGSI